MPSRSERVPRTPARAAQTGQQEHDRSPRALKAGECQEPARPCRLETSNAWRPRTPARSDQGQEHQRPQPPTPRTNASPSPAATLNTWRPRTPADHRRSGAPAAPARHDHHRTAHVIPSPGGHTAAPDRLVLGEFLTQAVFSAERENRHNDVRAPHKKFFQRVRGRVIMMCVLPKNFHQPRFFSASRKSS